MTFEIYVLVSLKDGRRYVGYGKNAEERLKRHNMGGNRFTKGHRPWKLVYVESGYTSRSEAMKREKFLKSGKGREWLDSHGY